MGGCVKVSEAIRGRRSVRKYTSAVPSEKDIREILGAGIWAPSGLNNQPWKFRVVQGAEKDGLSEFTKYGSIIKGAPRAICVFLDNSVTYNRDKDLMALGACAENIMLAAFEKGLGTCWLGEIVNRKDEVRKYLGTSDDLEFMALITFGYPANEVQESCRKPFKSFII
jgi:nitroreductase